MNTATEFFQTPFVQALGWALLHSLWQGLLVLAMVYGFLKIIPNRLSSVRYGIATSGLFTFVLASALTLLYFLQQRQPATSTLPAEALYATVELTGKSPAAWTTLLQHAVSAAIPAIVTGWMIGLILASVRLIGGWRQILHLKTAAVPVENSWQKKLSELSTLLRLNRAVALAESCNIQAPLVIGLCSGLSTAQLESILLHELVHIKRHDYVINLFQTVIETLFFFNPFTWILSRQIRTEREHCCDDAVVKLCHNPKIYVQALTRVQEAALSQTAFALSIANNKFELLNRIKRIMEKSSNKPAYRFIIIPVLLLVVGVICASWLTINYKHKKTTAEATDSIEPLASQDTTIKKNGKSASFSRRKITTMGPDGKPHEEIVEEFSGDEELRSMFDQFDINMSYDFPMPPMPPVEEWIPMAPSARFFPFRLNIDSLKGGGFFDWKGDMAWDNFDPSDFDKGFHDGFDEFFKQHQERMEKMMQELQRNGFHQGFMEDHENQMKAFEERMKRWEEEHAPRMKELEEKTRSLEKELESKMQRFEAELKEQLLKDGYLKKGDYINNMRWSEEGTIEINGKPIKPAHRKKYHDLHRKYFGERYGNFSYSE
jgi:bla regulator protein blaR1